VCQTTTMARVAVILSDTHLGTSGADPGGLEAFLRSQLPRASRLRLILNGDIVDLWRATEKQVLEGASGFFACLNDLTTEGATVDWVIGNHDHHLLRELDAGGSPILDALPKGIRFHRPCRRLVQDDRVFLITHGDVYDHLYIPLEQFGPLSWVLGPDQVYACYDWLYEMDKELISRFDREGIRGLVLAWFALLWKQVWERLTGESDVSIPPPVPQLAVSMFQAVGGFDPAETIRQAAHMSLEEVWSRTPTVLGWKGMRWTTPHPRTVASRRFTGYDEIICGHFHEPRIGRGEDWAVTDDGSWWEQPSGGTYVEISGGVSRLEHWSPLRG